MPDQTEKVVKLSSVQNGSVYRPIYDNLRLNARARAHTHTHTHSVYYVFSCLCIMI